MTMIVDNRPPFRLLGLVACVLVTQLSAQAPVSIGTPVLAMVAMRDGTKLATDVYLPSAQGGKWPAIVVRTVYGRSGVKPLVSGILKKGYVVVSQDLRGKGKSQGQSGPIFSHDGWGEHQDGHDTLDWVAKQPWSDGRMGMWGGSALGIVENLTAPGAPDGLRAHWVLAAFSDMYSQCAYQGGVWRTELIERWLKANKLDAGSMPAFLAHPTRDQFWEQFNADAQAEKVNSPAMFLGGWYDIFLQGTIDSFNAIQSRGGPRARGQCRLVIGPVAHGIFFGLNYPKAGYPKAADAFDFYDRHVKGDSKVAATDKPVHYYLMGDPTDKKAPGNLWRNVDSWPPPSTSTPYYFHADGSLKTASPHSADAAKSFNYDPKNPVPTEGGQNLTLAKGPMDQRSVESRPDVLVFSTEPLTEPLEITGRILAKLHVSSNCPDTDFTVKLTDVYPDGRSMLVTDGILRARFRESFEKEVFIEPAGVYELTVDLWSTALVFNRGHRIRIAVSSSNSPRFDPNPNTGKKFRADTETRIATNKVWLSSKHPSRILLPVR